MNPDPRDAALARGVHPERVTVAVVDKPQGRRGEVLAQILTDFPEGLLKRREVFLWDGRSASSRRPATITRSWLHKGRIVLQFEGCTTRDDAEKLRGWHVQISKAERVTLPAGSYYSSDLVDCEVFERGKEDSVLLGRVREVIPTGTNLGGPFLLEVETREGPILVPFAQEICPAIDLTARRIDLVLPEGLKELNLARSRPAQIRAAGPKTRRSSRRGHHPVQFRGKNSRC